MSLDCVSIRPAQQALSKSFVIVVDSLAAAMSFSNG